jgi:hypothetical protein
MATVHLLLLIIAVVCFMAAAAEMKPPRGNLEALGLAMVALAMLLGRTLP